MEMAQELGILPRASTGIGCSLPFESRYSTEKRWELEELGYRAEMERIKEDNPYVYLNGEKLKVTY